MKIKKLEVSGFKSFVDRTVLVFDHAMTCVVGPNGCGKSNIVDAMRWVLGEQSAKQLRGRNMEDVIFNGCETRGPHSFAEVTLTFDNSAGLAPPDYADYAEIAVTRRLDRDGNSDYLINKTPVRLLDVTNLFLGTGVGRKAYSTIEQGRIGMIVSARPEDRRAVIEEAAGITKFKFKKRAAERKMEQTRQNLLRVSDIIGEIENTLASLKRQAQKARRYRRYREEIRDLELWVGCVRWLELTSSHQFVCAQLVLFEKERQGAKTRLGASEAEFEAERLALQELEGRVERAQTAAYELDNTVQLLQTRCDHEQQRQQTLGEREAAAITEREGVCRHGRELADECRSLRDKLVALDSTQQERAAGLEQEQKRLDEARQQAQEAEEALRSVREALAEARSRKARAEAVLAGFGRRREETRQRLSRLELERERLNLRIDELLEKANEHTAHLHGLRTASQQIGTRREQLDNELSALLEQSHLSDQQLEALRAELAAKRSRLRSLEEIQQRFEGVGAGVRAVMTRYGADQAALQAAGVLGLVADRIECPAELTSALAGALAEKLQYIVVGGLEAGVHAVRFLCDTKQGRATLIPQHPSPWTFGTEDRASEPRLQAPDRDGVIGYLAELVDCAAEDRTLVRHLLGSYLAVRDMAVALELHHGDRAGPNVHALVTLDGQVLDRAGGIVGGQGDSTGEHMLAMKREVRELHDVVSRLEEQMSGSVERHRELRVGVVERQAMLEAVRSKGHELEISVVKAERDHKRAEEATAEARARAQQTATEILELERALDLALEEQSACQTECQGAQSAEHSALASLAGAEQIHAERRSRAEAHAAEVTELRVGVAQAGEQVQSQRLALERLERSSAELDQRATRLAEDAAQFEREQQELAQRLVEMRETLGARVTEAVEAHDRLASLRDDYEQARAALGTAEHALRELRGSIEEANKRGSTLALKEREIALELGHLLEQVGERHRVNLKAELIEHHARGLPDAGVKQRIDELHAVVQRMGEINLTAIEEYEQRAERHSYLTRQRTDLETALAQLEKAIRQMNRESRRLFQETFDAVNARFQKMYPRMFGGGKGELRLTDPQDLLESGIDIVAMPPGKKLGSMELMSGGEKALTAVSLIFAIFQYKPSPFCLLDEVDAPLDEANVGRFCEVIRDMTQHSQFILITHSKRTMEAADVLYGVTMETAGISKLVSVELADRDVEPVAVPEEEAVAFA